jgi:response regulator RpfG family c-di-GMP phosphodiesterase
MNQIATVELAAVAEAPVEPWTVLIVDDEQGLHDVTRMVLKRLKFDGRPLRLLSAYSADEARTLIERHPEIAVAVVDVVMENDQAGLQLVMDIRARFRMELTRIILRTGNPGLAPEREVIQHFEIDDYRDKTELTADRLYTAVYTALRAYQSMQTLRQTATGLETIIRAVDAVDGAVEIERFLDGVLAHLSELLPESAAALAVAAGAPGDDAPVAVRVGTGEYEALAGRPLAQAAPPALANEMATLLDEDRFELDGSGLRFSLSTPYGGRCAIRMDLARELAPHRAKLLRLFVERHRLSSANARLQKQILEAQREALGKLCEAVEMRSKETGQHIRRMAAYSRLLAGLAGLPPAQVDLIEAAAPLHDIGKVAIPDSILNKPGRLEPEEFEVMKRHARHGHELLSHSSSAMLRLGACIALTHHERWDGRGYPEGLAGYAIPIEGRIVSLADVFDALMSRRVYKPAFPFERSIAIIEEGADSQFDPELVRLFLANRQAFLEIFERNPDPDLP